MSDGMDDGSVAALAVVGIFILPVVGWIITRFLGHRERMEMIRHGITPPYKMRGRDWRNMAAAAAAGAGAGAGMPNASSMPQRGGSRRETCSPDFSPMGQQIELRKGIRLTFIGVALTMGLSFIGYHDSGVGSSWHPGPWLLGGLIPMFVGLAQVASAVLGGATFGSRYGDARMPQAPFAAPPFPPPPPSSASSVPPTYDSSYTYRPGDTQELRPPPMPPDRR